MSGKYIYIYKCKQCGRVFDTVLEYASLFCCNKSVGKPTKMKEEEARKVIAEYRRSLKKTSLKK